MHFEFLLNGGVSLLLSPENEAEIALLKKLMQQDNDLIEIRSKVHVLNKSFQGGILIASKTKSPIKNEKVDDSCIEDSYIKEESSES
jgi:hypothetical protein